MTPLQILSHMEREDRIRKAPDMPPAYIIATKFKDNNANALTQCVIKWIQLNGGQAERIGNTGRLIDNRKVVTDCLGQRKTIGSSQWIKGSGTNGTADISATIRGRAVKIEIKYGSDKQRPEQKQYQEQVERAGGIYMIVRCFDEFYYWYNSFVS